MVNGTRRYEVLSVLGQGGFGTVYRARYVGDGGFTKDVALKVLKPEMAAMNDVASRLRDEARVLGHLHHPAIVAVDRLVQLDGRWTVVMEYVEGVDLSKLLKAGPLPCGVALEIVAEVAGALHAAWCQEVNGRPLHLLHRDLKPSNIRITRFGKIKVLDFGIARAEFDAREAETRSLRFGTPEYMSPERLDYAPDDPAGDIYALGAILFELVTGKRLGRSSADAGRHRHTLARAETLLRDVPDLPDEVQNLTLSMLAWSPLDRPDATTAELVALSLVRHVGSEPLRIWAGDIIPPLLEAVRADPEVVEGEFTGSSLLEQETSADDATLPLTIQGAAPTERLAPAPEPMPVLAHVAPPSPRAGGGVPGPPVRATKLGALAGLGALLLLGGIGGGSAWIWVLSQHTGGHRTVQRPPYMPPGTPGLVENPSIVDLDPSPSVKPAPPANDGGTSILQQDPTVAVHVVTPPSPPPEAPMGRVRLEKRGNVDVDVHLIGPDGANTRRTLTAGETGVAVGRYFVEYLFLGTNDGKFVRIRDDLGADRMIVIAVGSVTTIGCDESFSSCTISATQ